MLLATSAPFPILRSRGCLQMFDMTCEVQQQTTRAAAAVAMPLVGLIVLNMINTKAAEQQQKTDRESSASSIL